jgi:hypothetical protein
LSITTLTISGNEYTAYASVAEADAFLAVDPVRGPAWAALTPLPDAVTRKSILLVAATRRLDQLRWAGQKTGGATQETEWPRTGVSYPDGTAVPDDDVPLAVEQACCLLAGTINITATTANAGSSGSNIKRVKAGSAEVEFFKPIDGVDLQDETAFNLIKAFLAGVDGVGASFVSGTGETSSFNDVNWPGLSEGYP